MPQTINAPMVIADNIDGEVIILNMESGKYYSTQGSGAAIWQLLAAGCDDDIATAKLSELYDADAQTLSAAVAELRQLFTTENLLREAGPGEGDGAIELAAAAERTFTHPEISSHTDMQGLLLLDPIHEVEDMGWPHKPAEQSS
jgi:Coenzyme PQQ synthesis protein D (PqqD)